MDQNADVATDNFTDAYEALGRRFAEIVFGGPYRRLETIKGLIELCEALDFEWEVIHDEDVAASLRGRVRDALRVS